MCESMQQDCSHRLTADDELAKDAIIVADILPALIKLSRSNQPTMQHVAAVILRNFANGSQQAQDALLAADALRWLIALLRQTRLVQ